MKPRLLAFILFCVTLCSFAHWQVPLCSKCHKPKTACICKATPTPPQPAKCKQCGKTNCRTKDRHRVCPTCRQYDFKCRYNCKHPVENFVPEYVDLGLSVRWATCNVGATRPEEYGDYFAWGETKPKSTYKESNYKWCNGSYHSLTKYCTSSRYGKVDNKTTLDLEDDAAHANWGGAWRMPTKDEMEELLNNCTWTWTTQNGVKGYKVTSKSNGNFIFLPAAGWRVDGKLWHAVTDGFYSSCTLLTPDCYMLFGLRSGSYGAKGWSSNRSPGNTVRAVYPNPLCSQCGKKDCQTNSKHEKCPICGEYDFNCRYNCHHPEYVDLGLSVKWATCNVGATRPEEYGDYFAWGETKSKKTYNWSTYKWGNGSNDTMTKYCLNSSYGQVDNKTILDPEDDAAHVNWGGDWRMPTGEEQDELRNKCTWTWTTQKGVEGYRVTSKSNGNFIFLPAAGYRFNGSLNYACSGGDYWSSSLNTSSSGRAFGLCFNSGYVDWSYYDRYYGQSVRAVCQ